MPYRIDLRDPPAGAFERLIDLGALDVEPIDGGLAAILPDTITTVEVGSALGVSDICAAPARGRDEGSVWVITVRAIHAGRTQIAPADSLPRAGTLRMIDSDAFGTGLHPTTALCLEAMAEELDSTRPACVLDVGTGSGVLALAALCAGVPRAVAIDIDAMAVRTAADNARLNDLASRVLLVRGGPEALTGAWPLVLANVLTAPLMEMAPALTARVARGGRLILSGIRTSLSAEVEHAYRRIGMRHVATRSRDGWAALVMHASW